MLSILNNYDNPMIALGAQHFLCVGDKSELENKLETEFKNVDYQEEICQLKAKYDHTIDQQSNLVGMEGYLPSGSSEGSSSVDSTDSSSSVDFRPSDGFTGLYQEYNKNWGRFSERNISAEVYNCFSCGQVDSIKTVDGVAVCIMCGIEKGPVISEDLECQYAGLAMGDNSVTARSGMSNNNLLPGSNLSTKIVGNKTSYSMKQINNVWDSLNYRERTLLKIFKKIADNCRQKGIPNNVINYTQVLFTMAYSRQKKLKKGNKGSRSEKLEGMIGGCIYYSCKGYNINRSHQEIAEICGVDRSVISFGSKLVFRLLHDKIDLNANRTNWRDFLERFAFHLNLDEGELEIVKECCEKVCELQLMDHSKPSTMVAVVIYLCANLYDFGIDKKDIAQQCHTTEPTLNKNYRILIDSIDEIIV